VEVALRPLQEPDLDVLAPWLLAPSIARWWGRPRTEEERRADLRSDDDAEAFTILAGGEIAGWLQSAEELDPDYRHGSLDIMVGEAYQERGHHRITIDPAAANERAIRCYSAVGFRPVGIMRRYERAPDGRWEDGLLMDLLADELVLEFS
jgi:aminoglycoside 6'-N-acetyltransferase